MDDRARDIRALRDSGILDAACYAACYADVGHSGEDPHAHSVDHGWREWWQPNFYFDPAWYSAHDPDILGAGFTPVLHDLLHGDAENRRPGEPDEKFRPLPDGARLGYLVAPIRDSMRRALGD